MFGVVCGVWCGMVVLVLVVVVGGGEERGRAGRGGRRGVVVVVLTCDLQRACLSMHVRRVHLIMAMSLWTWPEHVSIKPRREIALSICAHSCNEFKRTSASALVPSAGLTSRKSPTPVPSECMFHASPVQKITPTSPHLTSPHLSNGGGAAIFSISSALDAPHPEYCEKIHLDVSSCLAGPFYPHYHLHIREMIGSNKLPFTTPLPTRGKDHGENVW